MGPHAHQRGILSSRPSHFNSTLLSFCCFKTSSEFLTISPMSQRDLGYLPWTKKKKRTTKRNTKLLSLHLCHNL